MSIILNFYDIKATAVLPETFAKLIQRSRVEYSFERNKINEGLLIYTYNVDGKVFGISSETDYNQFKTCFDSNQTREITILEKQGSAQVCKTDALNPEVFEEYMEKVIQREMELAGERIKNFLVNEHVFSSHFHDHKQSCISCSKNIIGFLYKCTICEDTVFCETCMNQVIMHKHPCFKLR